MRAAVLCYHSNNVNGADYARNDHVALGEDLRVLARLRIPVRRLRDVVDDLDDPGGGPDGCVAITFDDGSWFDWYDLEHPTLGVQRSFSNTLLDAERELAMPFPATSFVIVSPQARATLDRTCLIGRGWWGDEWWDEAIAGGRLDIESHSWDHQHDTLERTATGLPGGSFANIEDRAAADIEIRQASAWLDARLPSRKTRLLAYPYGETSDYLSEVYLPQYRHEHGLQAAFTTAPEPIGDGADRWRLGRFVCGQHWKSTGELERLLRDALGRRAPGAIA